MLREVDQRVRTPVRSAMAKERAVCSSRGAQRPASTHLTGTRAEPPPGTITERSTARVCQPPDKTR